MTNFQTQHTYVIEKEDEGVVFAKCIRHEKNPEFLVGVRKGKHSKYIETIYSGTDKKHADELYSRLVSEREKNV